MCRVGGIGSLNLPAEIFRLVLLGLDVFVYAHCDRKTLGVQIGQRVRPLRRSEDPSFGSGTESTEFGAPWRELFAALVVLRTEQASHGSDVVQLPQADETRPRERRRYGLPERKHPGTGVLHCGPI